MFKCGTTMFIILQVAVFLCVPGSALPDDSVNGEQITHITQRWVYNTQGPMRDGIHWGLRAKSAKKSKMLTRPVENAAKKQKDKYTRKTKKRTGRRRTSVTYDSVHDPCDYLALACYRAYQTGYVCGHSTYGVYMTFKNYCMLDYVNCIRRYQTWQAIYMGECFKLEMRQTEMRMSEESSGLMDGIYVRAPY